MKTGNWLKHIVIPCISSLMLAGCVSETRAVSVRPADGVPAERALEDFLIVLATAEVIFDRCQAIGIRRTYSSPDQMIRSFIRGLEAQGYSLAELGQAADAVGDGTIGEKVVARLAAKGVRLGDVASLCRLGVTEIASGTATGRLLQI